MIYSWFTNKQTPRGIDIKYISGTDIAGVVIASSGTVICKAAKCIHA